ncbi:MAG TPA: ATP-binding protein [Streptosporangiaceae bacterium]|nr:ATP-binding protein [Streptosporangiaceae bacterium]
MPLIVAPELAVIITLDRDPAQAAGARRKVRELVTGWNLGQHADLAELVVSELVANALRHGAGPIEIQLFRGPAGLRVEVHDDGAGRPVRRHAGDYDECGRGLELLDGLIAPLGGAWGTVEDWHAPGKTVYAVLPCGRPATAVWSSQSSRSAAAFSGPETSGAG